MTGDAVLGEIGKGYEYAQQRLEPARISHCMRFIGRAARLMTWHVAAMMDAGETVKHESAMVKVFVSEAVNRVAERAVQITGALGISEDTPISLIARELRPFRIYVGANELHRAALARRIF